jgi:hypothetical protein
LLRAYQELQNESKSFKSIELTLQSTINEKDEIFREYQKLISDKENLISDKDQLNFEKEELTRINSD